MAAASISPRSIGKMPPPRNNVCMSYSFHASPNQPAWHVRIPRLIKGIPSYRNRHQQQRYTSPAPSAPLLRPITPRLRTDNRHYPDTGREQGKRAQRQKYPQQVKYRRTTAGEFGLTQSNNSHSSKPEVCQAPRPPRLPGCRNRLPIFRAHSSDSRYIKTKVD